MFYNTHTLPTTKSQSFWFLFIVFAGKGKTSKNLFDRDLCWCSWQAAQTVWNSQLLKLFESSPWPQFSNRFKASLNSHFFQICLNFPMSKLQKTRSILSPPLRTVGTVLTSWSWLSPLSSCLRKASAVFPCSDHSVYSGPLQDNGDNDGNEDSNGNEFRWWWLNQW